MITDLERKNIIVELEEGTTQLIETLEDYGICDTNDANLLKIHAHLDIIYEILEDENI